MHLLKKKPVLKQLQTNSESFIRGILALHKVTKSFRKWPINLRSEEHTSELQSRFDIVCRLLLEKKNLISVMPNSDNICFYFFITYDESYRKFLRLCFTYFITNYFITCINFITNISIIRCIHDIS